MILATLLVMLQGTAGASVTGQVRNAETGQPLARASVVLTNLNSTVLADDSGRYRIANVPAGPQHLTYRLIGYAPHTLDALVPRQGQLEINVTLSPWPVELPPLTVTTTGNVPVVAVPDRRAGVDYSASLADMKNHPLLSEPDALQAIAGGEVFLDPESPEGVHVRGGGSDQTAYVLDGIPILSPYHVAGTFTAWNPDAIAGLDLSMSSPAPGEAEAISGIVAARTRTPGDRQSLQGSISTSQIRATLDGPVAGSVGYLLSGRSGFVPGFSATSDASQVGSEAGDWLAKVEAPLLSGRLLVLGYYTTNEINADAAAGLPVNPAIRRNDFGWHSWSAGSRYSRVVAGAELTVIGWSANAESRARWNGEAAVLNMDASRHDLGMLLSVGKTSALASTMAGVRLERSRTRYAVRSDSSSPVLPDLEATTPTVTLFGRDSRKLAAWAGSEIGAALIRGDGHWYLSPRAQLVIEPTRRVTLRASFARMHQFGQSLRNPESVVGMVFPADLYVGAAAPRVPVARSDQATIGIELNPGPGFRITLAGYTRKLDDVLLVAPGEPEPFATRPWSSGSGTSAGGSLRLAVTTRRYSLMGNYGIQRVRMGQGSLQYVPHYAATHIFEGGIALFPSPTFSLRVGASGAVGRRTTILTGTFEWEACNLLDQGCEFGGSPHYGQDPLGGASLPAYFRLDASIRKHWHVRIAGREAMVALFGTMTNLLGRQNLLTYARAPTTGRLTEIEMRPLAPLVVGVDWRF